jgi:hypothetical protein
MSKQEIDYMAEFFHNLSQAQRNLEKVLIEIVPETCLEPVRHLNNAQIEVLKAVQSFISNRIEGLEQIDKEIDKKTKSKIIKKEKVVVE